MYVLHARVLCTYLLLILQVGVVTAPALFALEEHPQLLTLMERGFSQENDVTTVRYCYSFFCLFYHSLFLF
jgi:hypothetical protein